MEDENLIGKGGHSRVYSDGNKVIKVMKRKRTYLKEVKILSKLSHPNIIKLRYNFSLGDNHYICLDRYKGTIKKGNFSYKNKKLIIMQIKSALDYMHSVGIIHGDVKPSNILYSDKAVLCDFTNSSVGVSLLNHGTKMYKMPKKKVYGKELDYWGLAFTMYELFHGEKLIQATNEQDYYAKLKRFIRRCKIREYDFEPSEKKLFLMLLGVK